jgi:4'-phosphopantetheinyl transferase
MTPIPPAARCGPVRWTQLPHPPGVAAQALARDWLARELEVDGARLSLPRDTHGRPRLDAALGGFDVSWSHSGDQLLLALGEGVAVGADLERMRPRPRALELAQRFFAAGETAWLQAQPDADRAAAFVRLWCAKEAVLKAHGRGIAFGLHRFRIGETDGAMRLLEADPALGAIGDWQLHEFSPQPGYHAALAWRAPL